MVTPNSPLPFVDMDGVWLAACLRTNNGQSSRCRQACASSLRRSIHGPRLLSTVASHFAFGSSTVAAVGFAPKDITYFALSHMQYDHAGNANAFAASTWLVLRPERDAMFSDKPGRAVQPALYATLQNAKTKVLDGDDYDVFATGRQ